MFFFDIPSKIFRHEFGVECNKYRVCKELKKMFEQL